ncbi:LOW QUALITY PROTEIN: RNA binding motif protein 11 [Triplophysa dalaica]|uniref:LOW QUALITY PROTEIN: RNA binding motif protein 11 n=1 Tax=Triplophysa dalaica TaxID=1582913 RepID=UPI0024DF607D|nr:LOW QUALITY PROTEIN: RNA binding motif protein 11 [Triplophysa dalaica]
MSVSDLEKSILVGNIHSCVTEEILFELFLQAGPVEDVHIFRNGHQMPYGVVYYKHAEAVPYAVELLDGIWIYGQPIKLQCKYGGHYQENDIWCIHMNSGVIANSKGAVYRDDMASNVNNRPGVENHCKTPHDRSDMSLNRSYDMCLSVVPAAVLYSPHLQQWMESGYPPGHPTRVNSPFTLGHLIPMRVVQM